MLDINNVIKHLLMSKLTYLSTAKHTNKEYLTRSKDNKKNGENHSFKFFFIHKRKMRKCRTGTSGIRSKKNTTPQREKGSWCSDSRISKYSQCATSLKHRK